MLCAAEHPSTLRSKFCPRLQRCCPLASVSHLYFEAPRFLPQPTCLAVSSPGLVYSSARPCYTAIAKALRVHSTCFVRLGHKGGH